MSRRGQQSEEWLILVDEKDNALGYDTRENCHLGEGRMHRAFVVFLFNSKKELLVQKRSSQKLLWPSYWDVSATSHVLRDEEYLSAAARALKNELGITSARLRRVLDFTYVAPFGKYSENEYCVLLVDDYDGSVNPNQDEVAAIRYNSLEDLRRDMRAKPDDYTPWFKIAVHRFSLIPTTSR